ncbi:MAG TPA: hypothetical protein VH040_09000 [Usitatibacter sp.]|nr:hypothetical protein [Usitatibacter sp.]
MRRALIALWMLLFSLGPAYGQVSLDFNLPGASIGVNLPAYPDLQRVPGYPVYYAPGINSNYFFYDGLYWLFQGDNWYASSWYNGPWALVDPQEVPVYLLRVPVRYYRVAPAYFRGWNAQDPPHWGQHWGQSWEQRHNGWDKWDRKSAPAPAPLPTYQRQYSGSRYPQASQQAAIQTRSYRYAPKDPVAQQHFQQLRTQASSAPQPAQGARPNLPQQSRSQPVPAAHEPSRPGPTPSREQAAPRQQPGGRMPQPATESRGQPMPRQAEHNPIPTPAAHAQAGPKPPPHEAERKPQPAPAAHQQQAPHPQAQEKAPQAREHGNEQGKGQGGEKDKDSKEK